MYFILLILFYVAVREFNAVCGPHCISNGLSCTDYQIVSFSSKMSACNLVPVWVFMVSKSQQILPEKHLLWSGNSKQPLLVIHHKS